MEQKRETLYSDVVIIGAGFSGINVACQLQRKLGVTDFIIYERASDFGGAWFANQYPGCGVDIPAVLYSLSWFPNHSFTSAFPPQKEILEYIRRVAVRFNVPRHIKLETEWTGARWSEKTGRWCISLTDLKTGTSFMHEAKILISAVGGYTNPRYPQLPGAEFFQGKLVHTACWSDDVNLRDQNVVVIGNGCSASQVVPAIVDEVKSIIQFIRSPQYYIPMPNFRIHHLWKYVFDLLPFLLVFIRWMMFWILETALVQFYNGKSGQQAREDATKKSKDYVNATAPEHYVPLLTPSYDLGCRRRILDHKYLKTLHNQKVHLTNDPIASIRPKSVVTASGVEYPADLIILATGFNFTQWQADSVFGRNGISMQQHWEKFGGIEAYKTVAMSEFPNLFYLLGPNSGSGHTSVLYSIECATNLVIKLAKPILERRTGSIEAKQEAEMAWCNTIQKALSQTVLTMSCSSQFSDPNTRWNFFSYPFSSFRFWVETKFPDMSHWSYS
ncbi:hypothetical protein BX600DRAFT_420747 [Xylariales sp. PMI_506]|nr:hypothetical protein BX600DRAFT_420747 [Xylariales sp. PMI_506]